MFSGGAGKVRKWPDCLFARIRRTYSFSLGVRIGLQNNEIGRARHDSKRVTFAFGGHSHRPSTPCEAPINSSAPPTSPHTATCPSGRSRCLGQSLQRSCPIRTRTSVRP